MAEWNTELPTSIYLGPNDLGSDIHNEILNGLRLHKEAAIDTETTGLISWKDVPLYWSLAFGQKRYTLHASTLNAFQEVFRDPNRDWVFANAKYDAHILANVGINLEGRFVDTQVMHALLYEDSPHGLKEMARELLGWTWGDFQDQFGKITNSKYAEKRVTPEDVIRRAERENFGLLVEYAANDAWATWRLYLQLKQELEAANTFSLFHKEPPYIDTLWDYFNKIDVEYTKVLYRMERRGVRINVERLDAARPKAEADLKELERKICRAAGYVFNVRSNDDKKKYFYEKCGFKPPKWTKGGKSGVVSPSVDAGTLEVFAETNEVAQLLMEYAEVDKLLGTYILGLREHCDPHGRVHTRYNQFPRTGRLSSSGPNTQNIPKPENDAWGIRDAFIPDEGNTFISADYEQLEMRLLAAAAGEQDMIGIFERNWDIHMGNASLMYDLPYEDIENAQKTYKKVKAGLLPPEAATAYVMQCVGARSDSKNLGFG